MLASELHKMFKMAIDKEDIITVPSFTPTEIDYWLNTAQDRIVTNKFTGTNIRKAGVEQDQKRNDDLRALITQAYYTDVNTFESDTHGEMTVYAFPYPEDYMFEVGDSVSVSIDGSNRVVDTIESRVEYMDRLMNNSLTENNIHNGKARPIKIHLDNNILIYSPIGLSIEWYKLFYVKTPTRVLHSSTEELSHFPDYMWGEIMTVASRLALANTSDARYSAYAQESQLAE